MNEVDLEGILDQLSAEMPAPVRKVLKKAIEKNWELNKPGMTIALRLNHPTLDNAWPVYATWTLGRTPTGKLSWRFNSAGTQSLVPLNGPELLEYLEDPEIVMPRHIPGMCESHLCDSEEVFVWCTSEEYCHKHAKTNLTKRDYEYGPRGPASQHDPEVPVEWDENKTPEENTIQALGGEVVMGSGDDKPARPLRVSAPPLRVTPPNPA